ncbi:MAG: tetratricopeptide repeat protein [Burkholderiales bacterium]
MKALTALLISALLAGCAAAPPMPPVANLFRDELFAAPSAPIEPQAALAVSPAMRSHLAAKFANRARGFDRRKQLIDALYRGDLKLEYDAAMTRTASQAFEARSGNCLALVLMTAAFAKELGLTVRYQAVVGEEAWDRADDLYISIGHVNLLLEERLEPVGFFATTTGPMVVDFLPPIDARMLVTRQIEENTVVAMYLNNRAVESLTRGEVDDAYWWAREALRTDPQLLGAYVTLGVVYRTRHHAALSEQALRRVAEREPDNVYAMSNRILALRDLHRDAEAEVLARRLAQLDPHPPFSYFQQGMAALHDGHPEVARRLFAKEVERAPYHHEFEYWLAVSYMQLNDTERATIHLKRAMDVSTTRKDHDLYAGKLDRLKALRTQ